jgi:alkylhydroperoxidase family enzyme
MVQAVLKDWKTAKISEKDRALWKFMDKVNRQSWTTRQGDVDEAKAAGWSDEALYDAITVNGLFKFYNTWIDATGVQDMPAAAYEMSGKRMAANGYAK